MNSSTIHPIQVLREHVAALEAAVAQCEVSAEPKSVHKLRTSSRRLEAVVSLLDVVPSLPSHRKRADALVHAVAKVRRAAAHVRDLDVHQDMLAAYAGSEEEVAPGQTGAAAGGPSAAKLTRGGRGKAVAGATAPETELAIPLKAAAGELQKALADARRQEAASLGEVLRAAHTKVAKAAVTLLERLDVAGEAELPAAELQRYAEARFLRHDLLRVEKVAELGSKQLHHLRKAAKAGRYLAELLPEDAAVAATAARLQALQQLGGQWHDALEITAAARLHLGRKHALTAAFRALREQHLAAYRIALEDEARAATAAKPAPRKDVAPAHRREGRKAVAVA